jgi:hypothetical protein
MFAQSSKNAKIPVVKVALMMQSIELNALLLATVATQTPTKNNSSAGKTSIAVAVTAFSIYLVGLFLLLL